MMLIEQSEYKVLETLHCGKHSKVVRALISNNEKVIIKALVTAKHRHATRLNGEYEIGKLFEDCSHVIQYKSLINHEYQLCLVMEDIDAVNLQSIIPPTGFPLDLFLNLAVEIVRGIHEIHARGVVHKDIKPENIVVNMDTGCVKIIDFGCASKMKDITMTTKCEGTLQFISPEQTGRINRPVDYRSDLYSLGVTLYYMLCGSLPFNCKENVEWIHSHIAYEPVSPIQMLANMKLTKYIPHCLSQIIMKLLMKNPEDRYQSCYGLRADLENCLSQWIQNNRIGDFVIGLKDVSNKFVLCGKLYGRTKELATMTSIVDRVVKHGRPEIILVSGYSGCGKSTLVNSFQKKIQMHNGYFIRGKYEQASRNMAYSAITEAFSMLIKQILSEERDRIDYWRVKLQMAVGVNGQLLIDLIPELEKLIGKQSEVPQVGFVESRNRFQLVFQKFIAVFAQHHPIVLFLDDMQWIDRASASLLPYLIGIPELRHLLFIGSFRSNEVSSIHPAMVAIEECKKMNIPTQEIKIPPLSLDVICEWLRESLISTTDDVQSLASLVFEKTSGNPFFSKVFLCSLHEDGLLYQNEDAVWTWDFQKIRKRRAAESVIDIMIYRLNLLPKFSLNALKMASCLGKSSDLGILENIRDKCSRDLVEDLTPVINYNLGYIQDNIFYFVHDKVQEAASSLLSRQGKSLIHSKIFSHLLEEQKKKHHCDMDQFDKLIDIVDHMNLSKETILSERNETEKRRKLIECSELNLRAARKAEKAIAYSSAVQYVLESLTYLYETFPDEDTIWIHHHPLISAIYKEYATMQFLDGKVDEAHRILDVLLSRVTNDLERAEVMFLKIEQLTLLTKPIEAINYGRQSLDYFNIYLPSTPQEYMSVLTKEIAEIAPFYKNQNIEQLVFSLPEMTDPIIKAKTNLLSALLPSTYIADTGLFAICTAIATNLILNHGYTADAPLFFSCYGGLLCTLGEYRSGYDFADAALKAADNLKHIDKARVITPKVMFCQHWFSSMRTVLEDCRTGFEIGIESGQFQYGGYNLLHRNNCLYLCGYPLEEVQSHTDEVLEFGNRTKNQLITDTATYVRLYIRHLMGKEELSSSQEQQLLEGWKQRNNLYTISNFYLYKIIQHYLDDDIEKAFQSLQEGEKYVSNLNPQYSVTVFNMFASLIILRVISDMARKGNVDEQLIATLRQKVEKNQESMQTWAENRSDTFRHKYLLIEAEKARVDGNQSAAFDLYEQAIEEAEQNRFNLEIALSCERAADFFMRTKKKRVAKWYMQQAYKAYKAWGAMAKVKKLEARYAHLIFENVSDRFPSLEFAQDTSAINSAMIDLQSIFKASQVISGTIDLQILLFHIMKIIIETAGAQKGVIILDNKIEAETTSETCENIETLCGLPLERWENGCKQIISYVSTTRDTVVLGNAAECVQFENSPYLKTHSPRSILCMPVLRQKELIAVLYVENNLINDAFTRERVQVLSILTTQMAISLVNAKQYNAQIQAAEQIAEIQRKRAQDAENYRKKQDEFIDRICHEIRNPIHGAKGYLSIMTTSLTQLENKLKQDDASLFELITPEVRLLNEGIEAIDCCIEHQKVITDDVLLLSKLESSKVPLSIAPFNPNQIVNTVAHMFAAEIRASNITLHQELLPDNTQLLGDSGRITQVVINLFANAVKFVSKRDGPRTISVILETAPGKTPNYVSLNFKVRDSGIGMNPDELSRVFNRFEQANHRIQEEYGGSGLGLFISKNLVELMGGTICAQSQANQMTEFAFTVQCETPLTGTEMDIGIDGIDEKTMQTAITDEKDSCKGVKVLVAEDNLINRKVLVFILEMFGCKVDSAKNGQEAVDMFENNTDYDICFMDLVMPVMTGLQATEEIRRRECVNGNKHNLPIVGISGNARKEYSDQAILCGFTDYLVKPVKKEVVLQTIKRIVEKSES